MTAKTLWQLPVPSTALLDGGPVFEERPRREVALRMSYEADKADGEDQVIALVFEEVEAFKVTYFHARGKQMLESYDCLTDRGCTSWLNEIVGNVTRYGESTTTLAHLMIDFDDGPCYEVICRSYRVESIARGKGSTR
jgi:hypothetical protein